MAVTGTLSRLVWGGTLFDTEQWACSLHFNGPGHNGLSAQFVPRITAWQTLMSQSGATPAWSSASRLTFVKWNAINPITGKYSSGGSSDTTDVTGNIRGAGGPVPGQLALAVSLTTDLRRGRGHTGRFYMPAGQALLNVDGSGQMDPGQVAALASDAEDFLSDLKTIVGNELVVFSKIGQIAQPVTGCRIGSVLDTQRRRRSSLVEEYSSFPLVP